MLEQYADTAYRGKQDEKFRSEIATDERDSMYCRYYNNKLDTHPNFTVWQTKY
ncbi:hypothetical protein PMAN_b0286 [Pseudoalteromonas marina]|uniref:hypothetical protein n=1 Tax=Pseudoalteromonas marina TaxID=267375 RepID=UPI0003086802|nr:hypothetical protein [Pseudoalteromonas marina]KAF7772693.1 hypothetical protein PMAN_b0286 [Pseudoalteromonas marina]